jgi:hypothetical protein
MNESRKVNRKEALQELIVLPALAGLVMSSTAIAEAKASKAQYKYQSVPHGSQKCSDCSLFIPGKSMSVNGECKLISGSISPNGWCTAFTAKAKQ